MLCVGSEGGGGMSPSTQQENSKLEKAGKVNSLPSPALARQPHSAQVWFLERQRPLSFASRIAFSRRCLLPRAPGKGFGAPFSNPRAQVRSDLGGGRERRESQIAHPPPHTHPASPHPRARR